MDISETQEHEVRSPGSWIPATPNKPIRSKWLPIYSNGEENQVQANWPRSEISVASMEEAQASNGYACLDTADYGEANSVNNGNAPFVGNFQPAFGAIGAHTSFCINRPDRYGGITYLQLMELIENKSMAAVEVTPSWEDCTWPSAPNGQSGKGLANPSNTSLWVNGNGIPDVAEWTNSAAAMINISPLFAPMTPEKAMYLASQQVCHIQSLPTDDFDEEKQRQDHGIVDANSLLQNKELSETATDTAVCTPVKENHNPDKGDSNDIDLNTTPQKKQRRKKHRPKVIIEGKQKRTPKPVTPNPSNSNENTRTKRKYVRKNKITKPSTPPPTEETGETTNQEVLYYTRKSCRRALNFDTEMQPRDESSQSRSFNLSSELHTQKVKSRSNIQPGNGLPAVVENTQMGTAYELQIHKDNMSLPESCIPEVPAEHSSLESRLQSNTVQDSQATVDTEDAKMTKPMFNDDAQLPISRPDASISSNTSTLTVSGQTRGSKRRRSQTTKQADSSSTNLNGDFHNSLFEYQKLWVHFPPIYKKRRTEKGHNARVNKSSFMTATNNFVREKGICHQNDLKKNPHASKVSGYIRPQSNITNGVPTFGAGEGIEDKVQTFKGILAFGQSNRLTKKRSKGLVRARDLASLRIADYDLRQTCSTKQPAVDFCIRRVEDSHGPQTCIDALVVEEMRAPLARKKRTKKKSLMNSASSSTYLAQGHCELVVYNHHRSFPEILGSPSEVILKQMPSVDTITEQFKLLDINREYSKFAYVQQQHALVPYNLHNQEHNALVLYRRDGTVVPYGGPFEPVKKRQPRPKVDLDEETNKVWKLLMGNINSEGIDGTDEEKAKWWEEERRVFRGRADSFIARMHLVQGDRRFSKWKGSVLDSVIGVFLTQNVSDHLSSSAFMSLAARFPLKLRSYHNMFYQEEASLVVDEPEVCFLATESPKQKEQSIMKMYDIEQSEEKETVTSYESSGSNAYLDISNKEPEIKVLRESETLEICSNNVARRSMTEMTKTEKETAMFSGDRGASSDVISFYTSINSSQDSVDSSTSQTTENIRPQSYPAADMTNRSEDNNLDGFTSSIEFTRIDGSNKQHLLYSHANDYGSSPGQSLDMCKQSEGLNYDSERDLVGQSGSPKNSLRESINHPRDYHLQLTPTSGVLENEFLDTHGGENVRPFNVFKNRGEHDISEQSTVTLQSTTQAAMRYKLVADVNDASMNTSELSSINQGKQILLSQGKSILAEDPQNAKSPDQGSVNKMHVNWPHHSGEKLDVIHKTTETDPNKYDHLLSNEFNQINTATVKSKNKQAGKELKNEFDWDILRKQAEAHGSERERTGNTMDSLDWEAVRCADVKEIADSIKERGMNNMLAERIKDFLNRLVRDHGSIDLEWLRDVSPDRAKEYLLSVRGLGLKSVECVRLLTLHHLAFPVDTNVGRIAVRLGWVPLQPLPESLQLHLLELYPVLESIQKYLWPRLCKLDQRTLYELHYQMITFGKVFCTKSKPNCNACPMRGECRHFASAFASARLSLPAAEDKSIVSATESRVLGENPAVLINQLSLPPPHSAEQFQENQSLESSQQSDARYKVSNCEPIVEEPATPEPECIQVPENDIEDTFCEDPNEIPTIKLNIEAFTQNLQNYMQENMELQESDVSKALVALNPEAASIPMPKLKNISRLRTEHQVYELPDSHPLLETLNVERREPDDPCRYLLAIWTPGETADSIQPPERRCINQECSELCEEKECFSCNSIKEAHSQMVRGTLLIPCRTAMRGSFPLNGTYFQVNEVFADHDSSLNPIDVPRAWIWNLPRRTVYFGTSIPTIFKGLSTEGIQHCFWRGHVCVRGFDQKTRAPRPLMARLHFPASKLNMTRGKTDDQ